MNHTRAHTAISTAALLVLAGCSGGSRNASIQGGQRAQGRGMHDMTGRGGMPMMGPGGMMGAQADTAAAPLTVARAASAPGCPAVSQRLVDTGRAIFTGAGNCYACHGSDAHGTAVAPNLTDANWLDANGSYGSIYDVVRTGVPRPKASPAAMPPMGGANLEQNQVCAVAAYVYSLAR